MKGTARNLLDWSGERFPFINMISGFVMYFMVAMTAQKLTAGSASLDPAEIIAGGLSITLLFLIMRISDEHKDYQVDLELFPNRVLQSGRVTLAHLRWLGLGAILTQLALCVWMDNGLGAVTAVGLLNIGVAFLLNREFFVGEWMRRHMMLYALIHMVVALSATYWIMVMASVGDIRLQHVMLMLFPYWSGMIFEIARKSFGVEENKAGLESYSLAFGYGKSALFTFIFSAFSFGCYIYLLQAVAPGSVKTLIGSVLILAGLGAVLFTHARAPTKKTRKSVEGLAALFITYNYLSLGLLSLN